MQTSEMLVRAGIASHSRLGAGAKTQHKAEVRAYSSPEERPTPVCSPTARQTVAGRPAVDSLPKTKYARAADGSHIAYQVTGAGPSDLLLLPLGLIPVDAAWEEPSLARFLHRLGSFARVIRLDFVGVGLSDPASGPPTLER